MNKSLLSFVRSTLFVLGLVVSVPLSLAASDSPMPWRTDYAAAVMDAKVGRKPLLVKFTGSDWCAPCQRLAAEVFDTPEMAAFARDEIIAVYLDFPRRSSLPPELAAQNRQLAEHFAVRSYPTVLVLSPDEQVLGKLGYLEGGPKTFIRSVKRIVRNSSVRSED